VTHVFKKLKKSVGNISESQLHKTEESVVNLMVVLEMVAQKYLHLERVED
jgi:hypothetical protein